MALTPLTRLQQATVLALVEARRLDVVPADPARSTSFLRQADERLNQLPLLTSVVVRYGIAYDACQDTGEALLAALGRCSTPHSPEGSRRDPAVHAYYATSPAETDGRRQAPTVP